MNRSTSSATALFDTSSLLAGLLEDHPAHVRAFPWMEKVQRGEITGYISLHTLAELYSNLTGKLGSSLGIGIADALRMIEVNVLTLFEIVSLTTDDYIAILTNAAAVGMKGGAISDGIIGFAAWKQGVDSLVTLNKKHFDSLYPSETARMVEP